MKQNLPLNGKERGDPLPLPPTKSPNQAYQMHEDVMAQTNSVIETNINTFKRFVTCRLFRLFNDHNSHIYLILHVSYPIKVQ